MSGYSDEYNDLRWKHTEIRQGLETRMRGNGYRIVWKKFSNMWAADHIAHLECLWCGVLVWNDRLHRNFCTAPLAADPADAPPPELT